MSAALQICYTAFDGAFFKLPISVQRLVETRIDEMGLRLESYPHYRLSGSTRYRLRVGDYRVIYTFKLNPHVIHLLAVGHRKEIYRRASL